MYDEQYFTSKEIFADIIITVFSSSSNLAKTSLPLPQKAGPKPVPAAFAVAR